MIFKFVDLPFEPEFDGFRSGYRRKSRHSRPTHPCLFHWRASIFRKYLLLSILWSAKFVPPTRLPSASDVVTHQKGTLKWGYTNISLIESGPYFTAFWRVYRWNMLELFLQSQSVFAPLRFLPFGRERTRRRAPTEPRASHALRCVQVAGSEAPPEEWWPSEEEEAWRTQWRTPPPHAGQWRGEWWQGGSEKQLEAS